LTDEGCVEFDREETVEGRVRRYYRITETGVAVLDGETRHRLRVADAGRQRLAGRRAGGAAVEAGL
jgi:DNA-binding PadR family transcriptional regulator